MSTDYELVCEKHKHRVDISTVGMSGPMFNCDKAVPFFIVTHSGCKLSVMDEHQLEDDVFDDYIVWTELNRRELLNYDIDNKG